METLKLRSVHGIAKASGILLCVGGVIVLALYQGPELKSMNHHQLLKHHAGAAAAHAHSNQEWAMGIFLMTTSVVIWTFWTVKQVRIEICPPVYNVQVRSVPELSQPYYSSNAPGRPCLRDPCCWSTLPSS